MNCSGQVILFIWTELKFFIHIHIHSLLSYCELDHYNESFVLLPHDRCNEWIVHERPITTINKRNIQNVQCYTWNSFWSSENNIFAALFLQDYNAARVLVYGRATLSLKTDKPSIKMSNYTREVQTQHLRVSSSIWNSLLHTFSISEGKSNNY